jgi:hypothetical protein
LSNIACLAVAQVFLKSLPEIGNDSFIDKVPGEMRPADVGAIRELRYIFERIVQTLFLEAGGDFLGSLQAGKLLLANAVYEIIIVRINVQPNNVNVSSSPVG